MVRPNRQEKLKILRRRTVVAARYLQGDPQTKIALALETDQATISRDLQAIRKEWIASSVVDLGERKAEELAKIIQLESTYRDAWERSRQPKRTTSAKNRSKAQPPAPNGAPAPAQGSSETFLREELRDGDPRWLDGIARCIDMRLDIFGLRHGKPDQGDGSSSPTLAVAAEARAEFFSQLGRILDDVPDKKALVGELIRAQIEAHRGPFRTHGD